MADAAPAGDAVAMLEPSAAILLLPDHLIGVMWALIALAAALGLVLFGAALAVLETVLETIETEPGRRESST